MGSDGGFSLTRKVPDDFAGQTKRLRQRLGLTQAELASRLGLSFATVNRWENGQSTPSPLAWFQLLKLDDGFETALRSREPGPGKPSLDFTANPDAVRVL